MKEKGDQCILVRYSTQSKGYRVYNKRTRIIVESIHVRFDELKKCQRRSNPSTNIQSTSAPSTHTNVNAEENNNDQAKEGEHIPDDEFTNPFCAPTQEVAENPLRPMQTRRQLVTDPEMCMYALAVSTAEPKNIKEAMADSAWIEAMQEELYQFDRLQVWEPVDKPFGKTVINLKWLWKNKKDEEQTVIRNKARLVAKGYAQEEDGFVDPDHPEKVYRLRKALYGLKQAPRAWYDELSTFLTSKGFTKEAEYVALSASYAQVMWMRTQLQDYGFNYNKIPLYCDSQTEYQLADMFTKALPEDRFKYLVRCIDGGLKEFGIKDLLGGEVSTMMSPRGSIVASLRMSRASLPCTHRQIT
nr:hypothetical protein [Tanacetum cinerariifolium]